MRRRCCCGSECVYTVTVKDQCSPFNVLAGATVDLYAASTGGVAIATGVSDAAGVVVLPATPVGTSMYIAVSKTGCGLSPATRQNVFVSCGGAATVSRLVCGNAKLTLTINGCCGEPYGGPVSAVHQGVTTTGSGPTLVVPKLGSSNIVVTIPDHAGCKGKTLNLGAGTFCNNSSSSTTLDLLASRVCCNGVTMPTTVKFIDGLGVKTGEWIGQTISGVRSRVDQPFGGIGIEHRPVNVLDSRCILTGCTKMWVEYGLMGYTDNTASTSVKYSLACIDGGYSLTAEWSYRKNVERFGTGDQCYECGGVCQGSCIGNSPPNCASALPIGDPVDLDYDSGLGVCIYDEAPNEWRNIQTYNGTSTATATAYWYGTISDPDAFSIPFVFPDPGYTFRGPVSYTSSPPAIPPPPPPGGLSVTVTNA